MRTRVARWSKNAAAYFQACVATTATDTVEAYFHANSFVLVTSQFISSKYVELGVSLSTAQKSGSRNKSVEPLSLPQVHRRGSVAARVEPYFT